MATKLLQLNPPVPVTCFAFNKDRTQVALSNNTNDVQIYKSQGGTWVLEHTLTEHDKLVTGIDWAPESNCIVSCSQDRNAYVWKLEGNTWKPTLVILRINRAATAVKWSPKEDKFAVASGARCISVCYFEKENDWWVSKHIRKPIRSTVLSIDWHPNNVLIACGSTDFKARIFSGYIKGVDEKPGPTAWGAKMAFGDCMGEYNILGGSGWVHDVRFSPDGSSIAFVGHDATLAVVTGAEESKGEVSVLSYKGLPFRSLIWISGTSIVAAGHDCQPFLFTKSGSSWTLSKSLDEAKKVESKSGSTAMELFKSRDSRAQETEDVNLATVHQNAISSISAFKGSRDAVKEIVSAGVDGALVSWKL